MSTEQNTTQRQSRTYLERLGQWIVGLLVVIAIASTVIAVASVATAINTRELCQDGDTLAYLGSRCSP